MVVTFTHSRQSQYFRNHPRFLSGERKKKKKRDCVVNKTHICAFYNLKNCHEAPKTRRQLKISGNHEIKSTWLHQKKSSRYLIILDIKQRPYHFQSASTLSVMRHWKKLPCAHVIDINVKMAQASHGLWEHSGREPSPGPAGSGSAASAQVKLTQDAAGLKVQPCDLHPASSYVIRLWLRACRQLIH